MNKINVSIWGSCISRDIFNFDFEKLFQVKTYINFNSIISQMSEPYFQTPQNIEHKSRWFSKIIATDVNKNAIDLIQSDESDYIILDLVSERLQLLKVCEDNKNVSFITLHNDLMQTNLTMGGCLDKQYIANHAIYGDELADDFIEKKDSGFLYTDITYL